MKIIILVMMLILKGNNVYAIDYYELSPELSRIQEVLSKNDMSNKIFDVNPKSLIKDLISGRFKFDLKKFLNSLTKLLLKDILQNASLLVNLMLLAILCAILNNIQNSFCSFNNIAFYVCNVAIISILMKCFNNCVNITKDVVDDIGIFSRSVIPISTSLMLSSGQVMKNNTLKPFLLYAISVIVDLIKKVNLPLIYMATILEIFNNITDKIQISKLGKLLRNMSNFIIGFILTIFIGVITIKGTVANLVDSITGKTAKYMFGEFIPVVGKYLADVADSVLGSLMLIKNVVGIASVLGIVLMCIIPIVKLFSIIIILKIVETTLEPITDKRIVNSVNQVVKAVSAMIGVVFLLSVVTIFSFAILVIIHK